MVCTCTQENLLQGLSLVGHIAGKNAQLPILANVLIQAEGGQLKISTTNLEMAISVIVRGRVDQPGEYTVPAKLFQEYVSLLGEGKVELSLTNDGLEIKADGKVTNIKGIAATEFPLIPKLAKGSAYQLEAEPLRQALQQVAFAVSASDSRPELAGVACYFHSAGGPGTLMLAATDSYRLSERKLNLVTGGNQAEAKCIVPARAVQEIARILSSYKDDVAMPEKIDWAMAENQLAVSFGSVELVSRLIEGSFPDYKRIIPTQFRTHCRVKRTELMRAIRASSLFSRQGIYDVKLEMTTDGSLTVSSSDTGTGAHRATLQAVVEGESNKVTLNFKYVNDGLAAMDTDQVTLSVIDSMNAVVVRPEGREGFQYVVMPIRQ